LQKGSRPAVIPAESTALRSLVPSGRPPRNQAAAVSGIAYARFATIVASSCPYGLPTKLVTLWASSVALKRALLTVMAVLEARLSAADVTHGVMLQGTTPEM